MLLGGKINKLDDELIMRDAITIVTSRAAMLHGLWHR
jgi:hypothetical protein